MASSRICAVDACGKTVAANDFCHAHYMRWRRHGHPLEGGKNRLPKGQVHGYLFETVINVDTDDCFFWPHAKNSEGYAVINNPHGSSLVSRIVCEAGNGAPTSPSMDAAHTCGNGHLGCVNKKHLVWKSRSDNNMDKVEHGTHNRGERNPNAKLRETDVREILKMRGKTHYAVVAETYGVAPATIYSVFAGKSWRWLSPTS